MQKILPISSILSCGVWHKAPNTLSTLDEAVAALGPGAYIINGGTFNGNGTPDSAYIIDEVTYSTGWNQYGFSLRPPNFVQWTYLNTIKYPDFIGAYGAYLINGDNTRTITDATTMRTTLGLAADGVYIAVENTTIERSLSQAAARGCATAINLDGGGSSQYHLPDGTNYYGTVPKRRVLNWVYFKMKSEEKAMTNLPLTGAFSVTAAYGDINTSLWPSGHLGIDLVGSDTVYCTCDGTVRVVQWDASGWGQYVTVGDAQGRIHIFAHMVKDSVKVKAGDKVSRATVIGTMGNTGKSTGKHLHYQLNDSKGNPLDPTTWLHIPNKRGAYDSADYAVDGSGALIGGESGKYITVDELKQMGYAGVSL